MLFLCYVEATVCQMTPPIHMIQSALVSHCLACAYGQHSSPLVLASSLMTSLEALSLVGKTKQQSVKAWSLGNSPIPNSYQKA